jgi:hypothetical protein
MRLEHLDGLDMNMAVCDQGGLGRWSSVVGL